MRTSSMRMNYEFSRVYRKGRFVAGRYLVLHYLRRPGHATRIGVTASRQVRNSVNRNHVKRLLRESYRQVEDQVRDGYDIILVGRHTHSKPDYHHTYEELIKLLNRAGLMNRQKEPIP